MPTASERAAVRAMMVEFRAFSAGVMADAGIRDVRLPKPQWERGGQQAWEERMARSFYARMLAQIPREK